MKLEKSFREKNALCFASITAFIIFSVLYLFEYYQNMQGGENISSFLDTALVASVFMTILLCARRVLVQSYSNEKFHDFFVQDALLFFLWIVTTFSYLLFIGSA